MRVTPAPPLPKRENPPDHSAAHDTPPAGAPESDSEWPIEYRSHPKPVAAPPAPSYVPRRRDKHGEHTASPPACIQRFPRATNCTASHDEHAPGSIEPNAAASPAEPR